MKVLILMSYEGYDDYEGGYSEVNKVFIVPDDATIQSLKNQWIEETGIDKKWKNKNKEGFTKVEDPSRPFERWLEKFLPIDFITT